MGVIHKTEHERLTGGKVIYNLVTFATRFDNKPVHVLEFFEPEAGEYFELVEDDVVRLRDFLNALELEDL